MDSLTDLCLKYDERPCLCEFRLNGEDICSLKISLGQYDVVLTPPKINISDPAISAA